MPLPLGHRQAIEIRSQAAAEQGVAVDLQMVGGDRGRQVRPGAAYEIGGLAGGDVLQHHLQPRMPRQQRRQMPLDEHRLPVEHIHLRGGYLAVDQQRQADPLHRCEHPIQPADVAHAGGGIGGGMGGIELAGREHPLGLAALQLRRVAGVGEVGGHQRLEGRRDLFRPGDGLRKASGHRRQNALPIGPRRRHAGHRRAQVGHHDRPRKLPRRGRRHRPQHRPVPQVHMPVVRTAQAEGVGRGHPSDHRA